MGSSEFSLLYAAIHRGKCILLMDCWTMGDYHPTEMVNDKIFALLAFLLEITLHVTQPVRWDFAHVVLFDDEAQKIVRCGGPSGRVDIAWDYFDASINRLVAWGIGCL